MLTKIPFMLLSVVVSVVVGVHAAPVKVKVFNWGERRIVGVYDEHFKTAAVEAAPLKEVMDALKKLEPRDDGRVRQFWIEEVMKDLEGIEYRGHCRYTVEPSILSVPGKYLKENGAKHGCIGKNVEVRRLWPAILNVSRFKEHVHNWDQVSRSRAYEEDQEVGTITFGDLREEIDKLVNMVKRLPEAYPDEINKLDYSGTMDIINQDFEIWNNKIEGILQKQGLAEADPVMAVIRKCYDETPFVAFFSNSSNCEKDLDQAPTMEEIEKAKKAKACLQWLAGALERNVLLFRTLFDGALLHRVLASDEKSDLCIFSGAAHLRFLESCLLRLGAEITFAWHVESHERLTSADYQKLFSGNLPNLTPLEKA